MKKIMQLFLIFLLSSVMFSNVAYASGSDRTQDYAGRKVSKIFTREQLNKKMADLKDALARGDVREVLKLEEEIDASGKKVWELIKEDYSLDRFYQQFLNSMGMIATHLKGVAAYLLGLLALLEGLHMLIDNPTDFPMGKIMVLLVKFGLIKFLISIWSLLMQILLVDFQKIAAMAAQASQSNLVFSPQGIFDLLAYPIVESFPALHWATDVIWGMTLVFVLFFVVLISLELFMAKLEYLILTGFAILLLPFLIWKQSAGIGQKAMAVVSSQLARLLMLYFFLAVGIKILPQSDVPFRNLGDSAGFSVLLRYGTFIYAMYYLISKAQNLAGSLMSGGAGSMGGRDITSSIGSVVAKGVMAAAGAFGVVAGAIKLGRSEGAATVAGGVKSAMSKTMSGAAKLYNSAKSTIGKGGSGGSGSSGSGGSS